MSRAQWLAFGSTLAFVGCTGNVESLPSSVGEGDGTKDSGNATYEAGSESSHPEAGVTAEAGVGHDDAGVTVEAAAEAATEAATEAGPVVGCASRTGYYECGSNICDRSIQACFQGACEWYGALPETLSVDAAAACGPCPSCECLQPTLYPSCQCTEDAEGTLVISCAGCYGAPPARLERLS